MDAFDPMESLAASSVSRQLGHCNGVNPPIEPSTTFSFREPSDMAKFSDKELVSDQDTYMYSRGFHPTVVHLGRQLAALECTESAYCTSSGMAAISSVLLQLVSGGEHIVASNRLCGGTWAFLNQFAPRFHVEVSFVDIKKLEEVEAAFKEGKTKVLYFETMSNPALTIPDIPRLSEIANKYGAKVVVDNTFASLVVSPARYGAHIVIHSLTKFINGASDLTGGVICGPSDFIDLLNDYGEGSLILLGGTMQPQTAWQISTRLPHLGIRMREHSSRALLFASRLHSLGVKVVYAGLPSHPDHEIISRLRNPLYGFGGMLTIDAGSLEIAESLGRYAQNESNFGHYAVSLGFHDTLMCISSSSTAHELSSTELEAAGVSTGLIRVSVGFTGSVEQRWIQLYKALVAVKMVEEDAKWED